MMEDISLKLSQIPSKFFSLCSDENYRYDLIDKYIYRKLPDETYLKRRFYHDLGYKLNLANPKTFNEKMQWLKLHDRNPSYCRMVDKYEAKKYVASIIGNEYIIPTIGVWDRFEDIEFDDFPKQFVLKCTHDSGGLAICKDKNTFDYNEARYWINSSLKMNYYRCLREWPYKDVKPRIIAEKYMEDSSTKQLRDYKIHSFNGTPKVVLVCRNRYSEEGMTEDFFDVDWNHLDVRREKNGNSTVSISKPKELEEMLSLSHRLSKDIPFLRTDFYVVNGRVYFGELTFFPASGLGKFIPESFDEQMGEWLKLPIEEQNT